VALAKYRTAGREKYLLKARQSYGARSAEKILREQEYQRDYNQKTRGRARTWRKEWLKKNPSARLAVHQRARIYAALRRGWIKKSANTRDLLGCGYPELRAYLESQFRPGMTWENYGPVWHVDHRKPCASFDLTDPVQQQACFHHTNLQPLFAEENLKKGDACL
jgi:hypothetical protein